MAVDPQADLLGYLHSKGVDFKNAGSSNICTNCFICGETGKGGRGRLYISIAPDSAGCYKCFVCEAKGNLRTLVREFGDELPRTDDKSDRALEILRLAADFYADQLTPEDLQYLKHERGLTTESIVKHKFGSAPGGKALMKYLLDKGYSFAEMIATGLVAQRQDGAKDFFGNGEQGPEITFAYHVMGSVVQIRGKAIGGKYRTPAGAKARLFNSDVTWSADEVVIAEGELDCIIAEQLGYKAVGVPGAKNWQLGWVDYFLDCSRVWICYDTDRAGIEGSLALASTLGPKAKRVVLPMEETDLADWIVKYEHDADDFAQLLSDTLVSSSLLVGVDRCFEDLVDLQNSHGLKLGIEKLDRAIRPGLLPGQVVVLLAGTGTGKTVCCINLMQRMSMIHPEEAFLFVSLEQTGADWAERARRVWNFYNLDCPPDEVERRTAAHWRDRLYLVERNRISQDQLYEAIQECTERLGRKPVVFLDYLGYYARGFKGEAYERTSGAIMGVKEVTKEERVITFTPHQVSRNATAGVEPRLDDARDSGAIAETADFAITMWSEDTADRKNLADKDGNLYWRLAKSRHGSRGLLVPFKMGYQSLTIVPAEDRLSKLCVDELNYSADPRMTWREAIKRHRLGNPRYAISPDSRTVGGGVASA